jgi:adenosylhomocysteine nucleosidase
MRMALARAAVLVSLFLAGCAASKPPSQPQALLRLDLQPRIAVISAFDAELAVLLPRVEQPKMHVLNGVEFTTGTLEGKPVLVFLSGVSMTNAAMNTQLALDHFNVNRVVVSGIAGGVNPGLHVGDVTVAARWGQYMEVVAAREVAPGQYKVPPFITDARLGNFGMLYPRPVAVRSKGGDGIEQRFWFDADPSLLDVARRVAGVDLAKCDARQTCLGHAPRVLVGGNGVSGAAFVDNAALRQYTFDTFQANVLDMETAAVAHVAYSNGVPFIAFRSLSDLAGGGEGENEIDTFFRIAADNSARVLLAFLRALP